MESPNYTILKDILKNQYIFIISLLINNFDQIIELMKQKMPIHGEILEYLYHSMPEKYNDLYDIVCYRCEYIDNTIRVLFKNIDPPNKDKAFKNSVLNISNAYHISANEFEFYYYAALFIISIESEINVDAYNIYNQIEDSVRKFIDEQKEKFFKSLSVYEYQCLFYNHLENVKDDSTNNISILDSNSHSSFINGLSIEDYFTYMENDKISSIPIIMSSSIIYAIINNSLYPLDNNQLDLSISLDNIFFTGIYNYKNQSINKLIPYFNFMDQIELDSDDDIGSSLLNLYNSQIAYPINSSNDNIIESAQSYYAYYPADYISNAHYYISNFTIFTSL